MNKPDWMDGGPKQEAMAEQFKREIKQNAHLRRGEHVINASAAQISAARTLIGTSPALLENRPKCLAAPICAISNAQNNGQGSIETPNTSSQPELDLTRLEENTHQDTDLNEADTILLMFYIDSVFPFQFPFYRPSLLEGGKAWILDLLLRSPVAQKSALCQSSYFFSLAREAAVNDGLWPTIMCQTRAAFKMLRESLQIIEIAGVNTHLHGAVRILASILQVQRFDIAVSSFDNCQSHLNAALSLFIQLLESAGPIKVPGCATNFKMILNRLGPFSPISSTENIQIPSAEHVAFRFASTLVLLDDIIASTVLQEQPRLYNYHTSLLSNLDSTGPVIDFESVIGCQNWVMIAIGDIAAMDAWKQQCKREGILNVMEVVQRATSIKTRLEAQLTHLENSPVNERTVPTSFLDFFVAEQDRVSNTPVGQSTLVTCVWAHAALLYLFIVVSGWQPASVDVRHHVGRIIELLTHQISSPALLRTMVWPFCVAGCLAGCTQEAFLRDMVHVLKPSKVCGKWPL